MSDTATEATASQLSEQDEQALSRLRDVSGTIRDAEGLRREREQLVKQLVDSGVEGKTIREATGLSYMAFNRVRKIAVGEQAAPAQTEGDAEASG
jgi:hypothetical protein